MGRVTEQPIYEAVIRVLGREARVVLSPADGDESDDESDESDEELDARFGFDRVSDEGMLGHTALAALNLAVDCRNGGSWRCPEILVGGACPSNFILGGLCPVSGVLARLRSSRVFHAAFSAFRPSASIPPGLG